MRHLTSVFALTLLGLPHILSAQTYPLSQVRADIDVANIKACHMVHGDMWHETGNANGVEFPKGSNKTIAYSSAIWMAAHDPLNTLRASAQMYRLTGTDFWPGPIDSLAVSVAQKHAVSAQWAKIWKINSSEIDAFLRLTTHTTTNTPTPILEWPGKGNPYAKGASGATLTITRNMAPFVDVNADGVYNPLLGDYPKMKGSQMLWWIINDATDVHTVTSINGLNMEIRTIAYAYKVGTVLDDIIFYEYEVTNRSTTNYSDFRFGVYVDFDLGNPHDDLAGYNRQYRMAITYNGINPPAPEAIAGLAWLEQPGDAFGHYTLPGSYRSFDLGHSTEGDPENGQEYYYLMHSSNRVGQPYFDGSLYGPTGERAECDQRAIPNDRRTVTASKDYQFQPGQTMKFATALVVVDSVSSCPGVDFTRLHKVADTAYKVYWYPRKMTTGIATFKPTTLRMFPNPATNRLFVEIGDQTHGTLSLYDAIGRSVEVPQFRTSKGFELNTSLLPTGVYSVRHQNNTATGTGIFVKE